jgi:orotidine-5'-phosphate decarboxylase
MRQGKDYVIFPLDVPSGGTARHLVSKLHHHVGMFKIGLELFIHTGPDLIRWINEHTEAGIFLDLKLHDIPVTVERAMRGIADLGVELATVHCGESRAMLEAAVLGSCGKVNVLGVTVLTSVAASELRSAGYAEPMADDLGRLVLHKASMAKDAGCAGVVCSGLEVESIKENLGKDFLAVTPGIRPDWAVDGSDDQKRVVTPAMAVSQGADYVVIGRPIRNATDPSSAADRIAEEIDAIL